MAVVGLNNGRTTRLKPVTEKIAMKQMQSLVHGLGLALCAAASGSAVSNATAQSYPAKNA